MAGDFARRKLPSNYKSKLKSSPPLFISIMWRVEAKGGGLWITGPKIWIREQKKNLAAGME